MALSAKMSGAGISPEKLTTKATLTIEQVQGNFTITSIHLDLTGKVPGLDRAKFEEMAADAKVNCPVSRVLNTAITLEARLEN